MLIAVSIYAVAVTILVIAYVLYKEGKLVRIQFERDSAQRENSKLQDRLAQQDLIIASAGRGWQRQAGFDPLATTGRVAAPNTPLPMGARRVRSLTTFRLQHFDEQPTRHMQSVQ